MAVARALRCRETQLAALRTSDQRARNYVGNDQRLMASDVIFVESLEILVRLSSEVATARGRGDAGQSPGGDDHRQYQAGLVGGA